MRRALAFAALLATPLPAAATEADAAMSVTALVLDRCQVGASIDVAARSAVRLSLHCPRHPGCAAGFGLPDGLPLFEASGLERCRLDLHLAPETTRTPHLFQVDF